MNTFIKSQQKDRIICFPCTSGLCNAAQIYSAIYSSIMQLHSLNQRLCEYGPPRRR